MIYFIREEGGEFVKIGYTSHSDPSQRLHDLQIGNPRTLIIEATEKGNISREAYLHGKFDQYRQRGEWFYYSKEIQRYTDLVNLEQGRQQRPNRQLMADYYHGMPEEAKQGYTPPRKAAVIK